MKFSKKAKIINLIIWAALFLAASIQIAKGHTILENRAEALLESGWFTDSFEEGVSLFRYIRNQKLGMTKSTISFMVLQGFHLGQSLQYEDQQTEETCILEYETREDEPDYQLLSVTGELPILSGESYVEEQSEKVDEAALLEENQEKLEKLRKTLDEEYLIKNFYIVDSTTSAEPSLFSVKNMLEKDFALPDKKSGSYEPQILIYHTHGSSESFADSKKGDASESIIGVGTYLKEILEDIYGYDVLHDETPYDQVDGKTDRNKAYNQALAGISKQLEKYPSIQVVIDLHRDGVSGKQKKLTEINGKKTAKVMLFNGLSRNAKGPIAYLSNPNLSDNLAFSLQVQMKAMEQYPSLMTKNYLKGYRYNLHVKGRSLLVELGNQNNTLAEAKNAMVPFADVLDQILSP